MASEIRNLAEQSKDSVARIYKIISQVQDVFNNMINSSNEMLSYLKDKVNPDYEQLVATGELYQKDAHFLVCNCVRQ